MILGSSNHWTFPPEIVPTIGNYLVPSIILSGFSTPITNMPQALQNLTPINPLRYFIVILRSVFLEGATVSLPWPQYWPMAVAIVTVNSCLA